MKLKYWTACLPVLLSACSLFQPHPDWVHTPAATDVRHVLSGEAVLGRPVNASELPDLDLFELSPSMEAAADALATMHRGSYNKAKALHRELLLPVTLGGFGIRYGAELTFPAATAFARREVNCLSYTLIFVAMARHMGLTASANEVELPPSWDLRGRDSLMLLRHVNAKVTLRNGEELVVDLQMDRYSPVYEQSLISQEITAALFHNNRAMELLAEGQFEQSFLHLRKALALDGTRSYIWNNLGNLYYRRHLTDEAETAYLKGLSIDARDMTIMSNLNSLYTTLNEHDKADYFARRVREHRNSNPYYIYTRARAALGDGDIERAESLIRKALDKQKKEPRFYRLAAQIYEQTGNPVKAESMLKRAGELEKDFYLE